MASVASEEEGLSLEALVTVESSLEPYVFQWQSGSEADGVAEAMAYVVAKRMGGFLLALPVGFRGCAQQGKHWRGIRTQQCWLCQACSWKMAPNPPQAWIWQFWPWIWQSRGSRRHCNGDSPFQFPSPRELLALTMEWVRGVRRRSWPLLPHCHGPRGGAAKAVSKHRRYAFWRRRSAKPKRVTATSLAASMDRRHRRPCGTKKTIEICATGFPELLQHAKFFSDAAIPCNMWYYLRSTRRSSGDAGGEWMNAAAFAPKTGAAATDRNQQHGKTNANNLYTYIYIYIYIIYCILIYIYTYMCIYIYIYIYI